MKSIQEIRDLIEGPVNSIFMPFTRDGEIDQSGVCNMIERGIAGGSNVTMLTYGNSQVEFLTDQELADVTRLVAGQSKGRALTVACNRPWGTRQTVEFARYCRECGADIIMLFVGEYTRTSAQPELADFYKQVAAELPVMMVGWPDHAVLNQLKDEPRICSYKEDGTLDYTLDTLGRYGQQWKVIAGGGLGRHLLQWPFGTRAFLSVWSTLQPDINRQYFSALRNNDLTAAHDIVTRWDNALFALGGQTGGGRQTGFRGIFEIMGIAQRYRRAPMPSATDVELEMLRAGLQELGLS